MCNGVGQNPAELDRMRDLYISRKPKTVLEIGVWYGGTLREWLENATEDATVVAVDPEHLAPNKYEGWRKPDTNLVVVTGRTSNPVTDDVVRAHAPYDWVFVDGDHTEDGVRYDINLTLPLIAEGGLLLLHDIEAENYPPLYPRLEFDKLRAVHDGWEIVEPTPDWFPSDGGHGIGVVQL